MRPTTLTSLLAALAVAVPAAPLAASAAPEGGSRPAAAPAPPEANPVRDEGDEPEVEKEIEAQSKEMEQVREAEERAPLLDRWRADEGTARAASRLGLESPLRTRVEEALRRDTGIPVEEEGRIALLPELDHDLRRLQAEYDIPIEVNEAVAAYVRFFQTEPARKHFVKWLGRSYKYLDRYRELLRDDGLPEDTVFLAMIESGFANLAQSRARAVGPWQFISATGKRMGLRQDFWVDERRDPEKSARAASRYLRELWQQTGDWRLAWAGYNAGVNRILRAQAKGHDDFWEMAKGRVLRRETKGYVPKLMAAAIVHKHQEAFGFRPEEIERDEWVEYEEVTVPDAIPLSAAAQAAGVTEKEIRDLNPELRRGCTPPRRYSLKVPKGAAEAFARSYPSVAWPRLSFASHRVRRGESLVAIAAGYGVSPGAVARMNGLRPGRRLRVGAELVIPMSLADRRSGKSPGTDALARSRVEEYLRQNPSAAQVEPPPRRLAVRTEEVDGRTRATVLVQAGDTLWAIAQRFGVRLEELCRWNGISNPRRLKLQIGRELVVYPRTMPAASGGG